MLSLLHTCGMYDSAGEFSFTVSILGREGGSALGWGEVVYVRWSVYVCNLYIYSLGWSACQIWCVGCDNAGGAKHDGHLPLQSSSQQEWQQYQRPSLLQGL